MISGILLWGYANRNGNRGTNVDRITIFFPKKKLLYMLLLLFLWVLSTLLRYKMSVVDNYLNDTTALV